MHMKVRREIVSLFSWKKMLAFLTGTVLCVNANMNDYIKGYEGASLCEFAIFFLSNQYIILMLLTMAVIILGSDKYGFQNRYVILTRYRSRFDFYLVNICAKAVYAWGCVIIMCILLLSCGIWGGLSDQPAVIYTQVSYGIVAKQCLNILSYAVLVTALYSLFNIIISNKVLDVLLMMGVPMFNLVAVKSGLYWIESWLPWQKTGYEIHGWETANYRFCWEYWLMLIILCFGLGERLFTNKDIVYENR